MNKKKYLDRKTYLKRSGRLAFFLLGGYVLFTRQSALLNLLDDNVINENVATLDYVGETLTNLVWIASIGQFIFWGLIGLAIYGLWLLVAYSWNGLKNFYIVQKFYVNRPANGEVVKHTTKELISFSFLIIFFIYSIVSLIPFWLSFGLSALELGINLTVLYLFLLAWIGLSFTLYLNFALYKNLIAVRRGLL
jgi:hypothetical protein